MILPKRSIDFALPVCTTSGAGNDGLSRPSPWHSTTPLPLQKTKYILVLLNQSALRDFHNARGEMISPSPFIRVAGGGRESSPRSSPGQSPKRPDPCRKRNTISTLLNQLALRDFNYARDEWISSFPFIILAGGESSLRTSPGHLHRSPTSTEARQNTNPIESISVAGFSLR